MRERRGTTAAAIVAAAVLGFALWQHVMPPQFSSTLGLNPAATAAVHAALGWRSPIVSAARFALVFRGLLVVAFVAYGFFVWLSFRNPPGQGGRLVARVALVLPIVVALVMPADLSDDVYIYVGYARMAVVHGLNPHVDAAGELIRLGDPTAAFIRWKTPSPYGPLSTLMTMAAVALVPAGSVLAAVVVIKLLTAAALIGAALVVGRIAREFDPAYATAAAAAVALNPLLLIEAAGSAHNDIIAAAFVLLAFLALLRGRPPLAALAVGMGAAVKVIPLMLLPWLAFTAAWPGLDQTKVGGSPPLRARVKTAGIVVALGLTPLVVLYAPFWRGARTLAALALRWRAGHADAPGAPPIYLFVVVVVYLVGSALLLRRRRAAVRDAVGTMMGAWAVLTLPLLPLATDKWFPWYLTWAWAVAPARRNLAHAALIIWLLALSLILTLHYAVAGAGAS